MNLIKKHRAKIAIYMFLTLGSIIMVTPFLYTLSRSLHNSQQIFAFPFEWIPDPFTWSNYSEAYSKFGTRTFLNSALLTLIVVVGQATLGMMAGFLLKSKSPMSFKPNIKVIK